MKKMLLMAISIGIMGSGCANAKVSDAQLLAHLKNIRKEVVVITNENTSSSILDDLSLELINQFYNKAKVLHKIVTDDIARLEFDVICDNIMPLNEMEEQFEALPTYQRQNTWVVVNSESRPQHPVHIDKQETDKLFKLFIPIFKKVNKKYSAIFQSSMDEQTIQNWFDRILSQILFYPASLGKNWPLLKLIDAKIAELEAQVS